MPACGTKIGQTTKPVQRCGCHGSTSLIVVFGLVGDAWLAAIMVNNASCLFRPSTLGVFERARSWITTAGQIFFLSSNKCPSRAVQTNPWFPYRSLLLESVFFSDHRFERRRMARNPEKTSHKAFRMRQDYGQAVGFRC